MKSYAKMLGVLAALFTVAPAFADDVSLPDVLQQMKEKGGAVDYLGNAYGVDGWRVVRDLDQKKAMYVYTTPQGGVLLGMLVSPDGKTNVTAEQVEAFKNKQNGGQAAAPGAEQSPVNKTERLYAQVEKAGWARVGDENAPYLYVFMNTYCDHCQEFWREMEPSIKAGKLQVRLVPFGQVAQNRESGAALLSVADPGAAWDATMKGDKAALSKDKIKDGMLDRIDANTALVRDWKLQGPPFTLYRKPSDGELTAIVGKPDNTMEVLADLMKSAPAPKAAPAPAPAQDTKGAESAPMSTPIPDAAPKTESK